MSTLEIVNAELYADRTFQNWHRKAFGREDDAIDIDLYGVCHNWKCRKGLYLIESSTDRNKSTSILRALAKAAGVNAYLVLHDGARPYYARRIWPDGHHVVLGEESIQGMLKDLRLAHFCDAGA